MTPMIRVLRLVIVVAANVLYVVPLLPVIVGPLSPNVISFTPLATNQGAVSTGM
ncbi:hypothetical protein D3C87_1828240 [compost metagenome]